MNNSKLDIVNCVLAVCLLCCCCPVNSFSQERYSEDKADLAEAFLERFSGNVSHVNAYAVAINFSSLKLENSEGPVVLDSEILICVDEQNKYRRVTYRSNSINLETGDLNQAYWQTEISRKGKPFLIDENKEVEAQKFRGFFSYIDPFETSACSHDFLRQRNCGTGFLFSVIDTTAIENVSDDGKGIVCYSVRLSPSMILELSTSAAYGGMPIRAVYKIAYNDRGARNMNPNSLSDFKFVTCSTDCKWKKFGDVWFPIWTQMDRVYGKARSNPKERYELNFNWLVGEELGKYRELFESVDHSAEANLFFDVLERAVLRSDE